MRLLQKARKENNVFSGIKDILKEWRKKQGEHPEGVLAHVPDNLAKIRGKKLRQENQACFYIDLFLVENGIE